jgi:WD40 repeat protein
MKVLAAGRGSSASLTDAELALVAGACDACEAAWRNGLSPRVESFLGDTSGPVREVLLFELLAIEACYRADDLDFTAEACVGRFPEHAESIRRWFSTRFLMSDESAVRGPGDSASLGRDAACADANVDDTRSVSGIEDIAATAESESTSDVVGHSALERFRVLRPCAEGGLGRIWVAHDVELGRDVAFKEIQPHHADDPAVQARFVREAEITGRLEHPGVVPVYGRGQHADGRPFYAMRLIEGETFEASIGRWHATSARYGDFEFRQLLRRFLDVCNVVEFAHRRGVVHRDIKPRNVMIGQFGETLVLDWGLARQIDEPLHGVQPSTDRAHSDLISHPSTDPRRTERDSALTAPGMVFGTPAYMSPEQAAGRMDEVGPANDIFCLGGMFYCLLTGQAPYAGGDRCSAIGRAAACEFPRPRAIHRRVPTPLQAICLRAMKKEPQDRYASARALANDLEHWLADEPIAAHRERWPAQVFRWARRHKTLASATAIVAAVVIAALGAIIFVQDRSRQEVIARNAVIERQRDESFTLIQREQLARAGRAVRQFRPEARAALRLVPEPRRGWEWRRLSHQLDLGPRAIESFGSHDWGVLDILWDEATSVLVTAGHDGRLLVWRNGKQAPVELVTGSWSDERLAWRHTLLGIPGERDTPQTDQAGTPLTPNCFVALGWIRPGSEFVAVSLRGNVTAWQLTSKTGHAERRELAKHGRPIHAVAIQNGKVLCGDDRGTLLLVDAATLPPARQSPTLIPLDSPSSVVGIEPLADGRWIVAQAAGEICVLDAEATRVIGRHSTDAPIWDADVAPDGKLLAVARGRSDIVCYRVEGAPERWSVTESYQIPDDLTPAASAVHAVRFSPDGRFLAGGDDRGRLIVWQTDTARVSMVGESGRVLTVDRTERLPSPFRRRTAAIRFGASADECFLGGHDPVVRRWRLRSETGVSSLQVDRGALVRFDPLDPELLWIATNDMLSLRDSRDGLVVDTTAVHRGPITGFAIVARAPTVESATHRDSRPDDASSMVLLITCGQDGAIRGWTRRGKKIVAACEVIRHSRELADVALSPDGRRAAACDSANCVMLWDLVDGRLRASHDCAAQNSDFPATSAKSRKRKLAPKPRLAFNANGTRLAVFGPAATCSLLDGSDLSVIERPYLLAGDGGTALLWHPHEADTLFAGDTLGRIARHPSRGWGELDLPTTDAFGVVGITYSRNGDGGRLAVAWRDGTVRIIDPKWAGEVLVLQSSLADARRPNAADVQFDPSGSRLALVHDDGAIEIWETPRPSKLPPESLAKQWHRRTLLEGDRARGLELRPQAITLDQAGRLAILFTALDDGQYSTDPEASGRVAFFGRERSGVLRLERLPGRVVPRSLALEFTGNGFLATLRRSVPSEGGTSGAFLLLRAQIGADDQIVNWKEEELAPTSNNEGFDPQLLPGPDGFPAVVHFSHAGHYLMATWHDAGAWRSARLGRQGDGLRQLAALDVRHQSLYCCFSPMGWGGTPLTPVCITTTAPWSGGGDFGRAGTGRGHREVILAEPGGRQRALALAPDGTPLVLYSRPAVDGRECLAFARRETAGWRSSTVLDFCPNVSNLAVDRQGLLSFAFVEEDQTTLYLATGRDGRWSVEPIGELPPDTTPDALHSQPPDLALVTDPAGRINAIVATRSNSGAIWAFRPID